MSRRASVLAATLTLQHAPDLVRYGSKPARSTAAYERAVDHLRSFEDAVRYPPNQVFIGALEPERLWDLPRPWWGEGPMPGSPSPVGRHGEIAPQAELYRMLAEADQFGLVRLDGRAAGPGELELRAEGLPVGAIRADHDADDALTASVLLENLAAKAGATHALRVLLAKHPVDPAAITFLIGAGEEAVGDRYQRGGGGLAKSVAEACGLANAGAFDLKAFCAAPIHALVAAGALVEAGVHDAIAVVAGGSLAKLGMKYEAGVRSGAPILEDTLAAMAVIIGSSDSDGPILRLDAVGTHRVGAGSSQKALLDDIVVSPLTRLGWRIGDIDRYATELHNPEITEPAQGGDVPDKNYRMIAAAGVMRGDLDPADVAGFARAHGLPGFSPTQGHIASAMPWLPWAVERSRRGEIRSTMLLAKGSLFLGRLTRLWDGISVVMEA